MSNDFYFRVISSLAHLVQSAGNIIVATEDTVSHFIGLNKAGTEGGSLTFDDVGGAAVLASNCYWNGTNWVRIDITKTAWLFILDTAGSGSQKIYGASDGANPIASWDLVNGIQILKTGDVVSCTASAIAALINAAPEMTVPTPDDEFATKEVSTHFLRRMKWSTLLSLLNFQYASVADGVSQALPLVANVLQYSASNPPPYPSDTWTDISGTFTISGMPNVTWNVARYRYVSAKSIHLLAKGTLTGVVTTTLRINPPSGLSFSLEHDGGYFFVGGVITCQTGGVLHSIGAAQDDWDKKLIIGSYDCAGNWWGPDYPLTWATGDQISIDLIIPIT